MASRSYAFVKVDVFTTVAFEGNPLAVFTDATGLEAATMQRIACELNLSETTFVFPPADPNNSARVRIFTPRNELPFAGHPTIGTAFVVRGDSETTELVLEEGIGPVPVRVALAAGGAVQYWLTTPPITFGEKIDPNAVIAALGLRPNDIRPDTPPEVAGAGPKFIFVGLRNREAVDRIELLDYRALRAAVPNAPTEVFVFATLEESDGEDGYTYAGLFAHVRTGDRRRRRSRNRQRDRPARRIHDSPRLAAAGERLAHGQRAGARRWAAGVYCTYLSTPATRARHRTSRSAARSCRSGAAR